MASNGEGWSAWHGASWVWVLIVFDGVGGSSHGNGSQADVAACPSNGQCSLQWTLLQHSLSHPPRA